MSVLDQLQIPQYSLVAEGVQGCVPAIWIAIERPRHVKGLQLISPCWATGAYSLSPPIHQ